MIALTGDPRFVFDSYRRLVQMFGSVVMGLPDEVFEECSDRYPPPGRRADDAELTAEQWQEVTTEFKRIFRRAAANFPEDPTSSCAGHRGGVQKLERQTRHRLPQRRQHPPRPGTAVNIVSHGVRQHGRGQRHRASP
jgi:hypothetical protein